MKGKEGERLKERSEENNHKHKKRDYTERRGKRREKEYRRHTNKKSCWC